MSRADLYRLLTVVLLVGIITALHYLTTLQMHQYHDIYRRLYYIPIVLGALWFSLRGGLATAIAVSILFAPHVVFQWGHHPASQPEQYLEILLYNFIGFLTGFLTERERLQKNRYQRTAARLEESYSRLREQADLVLEIEEQLRRADRLTALGELSAGMAHEIRNPLGSIRGTAEILQDGIAEDDPRYEFTRILIREVDRLNKVVQDFLRFARPTPVERSIVDLNDLAAEVFELIRQPALRSGVDLILQPGPDARVGGDHNQLKQVLLNLSLNALQAMPSGGSLICATERTEGQILLRVRDSGQGIPADHLDRIFNPFFTTRQEGTGLGLAITHRIIQGHGGRIEVDSRPGEGTTFTFWLPSDAFMGEGQ